MFRATNESQCVHSVQCKMYDVYAPIQALTHTHIRIQFVVVVFVDIAHKHSHTHVEHVRALR